MPTINVEGQSTGNTFTDLFVDGVTNDRMDLPEDGVWLYEALIMGVKDSNNDDVAMYKATGAVRREGSSSSSFYGNAKIETIFEADQNYDVQVVPAANALQIRGKGGSGETINWKALVTYVEMIA